jgi:hypothetical protein
MKIETVFREVRADGAKAQVSVTSTGRTVFSVTSPAGRVALVVRFDGEGGPAPMVTGWSDDAGRGLGSESLAADLLAGYGWWGREWLFDALADALT